MPGLDDRWHAAAPDFLALFPVQWALDHAVRLTAIRGKAQPSASRLKADGRSERLANKFGGYAD